MAEHGDIAAAAKARLLREIGAPASNARMSRRALVGAATGLFTLAASGVARAQYDLYRGEGMQDEWRHCNNCFGLFYSPGGGQTGVCAMGGHHVPQGFKFQIYYSSNRRQPIVGVDSQFDWRFCEKCWLLFFDGGSDFTGVCPVNKHDASGNKHMPRGFMFGLAHNSPAAPGQNGWRFCWRCWSLFYGTASDGSTGFCPAGGKHQAASNSFDFYLPFTNDWVNAPGPPPKYGFNPYYNGAGGPPPNISVTTSGGTVKVSGTGFTPGRPVQIRVVMNNVGNNAYATTVSNGSGAISTSFACSRGNAIAVSASDGRAVPSSVDATGVLWSNTQTVNCQ